MKSVINSMTACEIAMGLYNVEILGVTIEHPFVFIFLLPTFIAAIYIGFNHPRLGTLITSFLVAGSFLAAIIIVAIGFSITALADLSFFISVIPLMFVIGCISGWGMQFSISRTCRNREGGKLCDLVY